MDTLKTIKEVREVTEKLIQCRDFIINKQKKSEYDNIIQELRLLEDALLAKNPLNSLTMSSDGLPSGGLSLNSGPPLGMNDFRVMVDQRGLTDMPSIQMMANQNGINPQLATTAVQNMQQSRQRAEVEALTSHLIPDIRARLYNRHLSANQIQVEVTRFVQAEPTVPTELVTPVSQMITQSLIREARGG